VLAGGLLLFHEGYAATTGAGADPVRAVGAEGIRPVPSSFSVAADEAEVDRAARAAVEADRCPPSGR